MRSMCVNAANIPLARELIASVRSARTKYVQTLEQQRSVKEVTQKYFKRKVISEEIEEVLKKKRQLHLNIDELLKDAVILANKAEKKSDLLMLGRSNDTRRLSNTKNRK